LGLTTYLLVSTAGSGARERGEAREPPDLEAPARAQVPAPPPERAAPDPPRTAWPISGTVRDEAGRPVPGALVVAFPVGAGEGRQVVCGAAGQYALDLPAPATWAFEVYASGYEPIIGIVNGRSSGLTELVCEGEGPWRRDFVLREAAALRGRVLDGALRPVPGALVYVISPQRLVLDEASGANTARSDERGDFRFFGLRAAVYDLGVHAEGFLPALDPGVEIPARGLVEHDLHLRRGRSVKVRVTGADLDARLLAADSRLRGRLLPPGGRAVLARGLVGRDFAGFPVYDLAPSSTGKGEATFLVTGLPPGPVDFEARAPGLLADPGVGSVLDSTAAEVELRLLAAELVEVAVHDALSHEPLEPRVSREGVPVRWRGKRILVPRDGAHRVVRFELEGYEPSELEIAPGTPQPVQVFLQPAAEGATGSFHVVFDPLLTGRAAFVGRDADGRRRWIRHLERSDDSGRWTVAKVPVGTYAVTVLASRMVPVTLPRVVVARGRTESYRVHLSEGGGLTLEVQDGSGALLDQVSIALEDEAGRPIDVQVLTKVSEGRAFVSVNYLPTAAAVHSDSGLAPGGYALTAVKEGYEPAREVFAIHATETAEVTLVLRKR